MSEQLFVTVEIGGSSIQSARFEGASVAFFDGLDVPPDAPLGVAVPGELVDGRVFAPNLGWNDADMSAEVDLPRAPDIILNDAEAAALGEWVLRGGVDASLVFVGLGTGVGGAVVRDGRPVASNLFGHQTGFGPTRCKCGRTGCLETVASGWALPRRVDGDRLRVAASAIAEAVAAEPLASAGVIVVGGGLASRHPAIVDHIAADLPDRHVVRSTAPAGAKSAAHWGLRHALRRRVAPHVDLRECKSAAACAMVAADLIETAIRSRPDLRLGVATGRTPLATYDELIRRGVSLDRARVFLLDEYVGLGSDDPRSYLATVSSIFGALGVHADRLHAPDPMTGNLDRAARDYENVIAAAGGIDLQVLGLGRNGHLGFNEPGSPLDSVTRVVTLTETTRADNSWAFENTESVPRRAITQGLATIARARTLLLLSTGRAKADALSRALWGDVGPACPASMLQRHPHATVIADRESCRRLPASTRD